MQMHTTSVTERALLVQVIHGRRDPAEAADSLEELARLADTAGMVVAGQMTQRRPRPDGGYLLGRGKVEDVRAACEAKQANLLLFDNELNAIQAHNLRKTLTVPILDRTEVILQIFARRARTAAAQVQVELAQLEFLLSRIPEAAAQQRFKGGTSMRGPGESHLQLRNEPMRRRIRDLRKRLDEINAQQSRQHVKRQWPVVCLTGYTNAGKSTLLNRLAGGDAYVDDRLFATLDTKTRMVSLGTGRRILLTDTVGFIRHLPHALVASFRSTLDVAAQADLLLVVADASHPRVQDHLMVSLETLREIGAGDVPRLLVLNKCDRGDASQALLHGPEQAPQAIPVSALTGHGLEMLKQAMLDELRRSCPLWQLPPGETARR
ncbi:MAG: GTPase HflX [Kiritimatiellae bacterium]|nr:GTPase HflX [Kiritimatiellia bacterium]